MQRRIKSTEGDVLWISKTIRLGHSTYDKNDPEAYEEVWVLHNTEGPALIKANGKKEYYFWGIYKGDNPEAIKELKRDSIGLPPAKNPLYKNKR